MKLLHLTKIATFASLLALSNISCAADPVRPSTTAPTTGNPPITAPTTESPNIQGAAAYPDQRTSKPAAGFTVNKNGYFVPLTKSGVEFVQCSENGKGSCEINNQPVVINQIKTTVITEIVHTGSPTCLLYCIQPPGQPARCFNDPTVPACAALNRPK